MQCAGMSRLACIQKQPLFFLKNEARKPLLLWLQAVRSVKNKAINSNPMFSLRGVSLVKF